MNIDELVAHLEVQTNRLEEENRKAKVREHNARMMSETLGKADV